MNKRPILIATLVAGSLVWIPTGCKEPPAAKPATESRPSDQKPTETELRVKKIVSELLGAKVEKLNLTDRFKEDLKADSLDCVEIVMAIEEQFKLEIPDQEAEKMATIGQVVSFLRSQSK